MTPVNQGPDVRDVATVSSVRDPEANRIRSVTLNRPFRRDYDIAPVPPIKSESIAILSLSSQVWRAVNRVPQDSL